MPASRGRGVLAVVLLVVGLVLMLVPALARDGICGLFGCADQVPDIAVTRSTADTYAVLVPGEAAPDVRVVRLLEGSGSSGSQQWAIRRASGPSDEDVPDTFVAGEQPPGFRTVTELEAPPERGAWVAEVGFGCTTASLPFSPETMEVGEVRSWAGATDGTRFTDTARTSERCGTERSTPELVLFWVGALSAVAGAVLGIFVVLSRPVGGDAEDPWSDGDDAA